MNRSWQLDYDTANCNIAAALDIVGEKWTFLVLREAFNGIRRFDDMQRRIPQQGRGHRAPEARQRSTPTENPEFPRPHRGTTGRSRPALSP